MNCHSETETDWKVRPAVSEGSLALGRLQWHTRDSGLHPFIVASDDIGGDILVV